jgi:putative tryptophan/tyrosine transport system substrate-binding protein
MIDRRAFLGTVALAVLAAPRLGDARPMIPARVPRVGILGEANPIPWTVSTPVVEFEWRWADAQRERLPDLASQLVALDVDVIVALGAASARAASQSTTRVPIVVVADGDLGEEGVVARLARSAANITWLSAPSEGGMARQRLRLLGRLVPRLQRVGVLFNPDTVGNARVVARLPDHLRSFPARSIEDVERMFLEPTRDAVDGLLVLADTLFTVHATRLVELTAEAGVPAAYGARVFVEAGGLSAVYGDTGEIIRRAATIVRRILAGETPASLSPSRSRPQVVLNAPVARRLGLAVAPDLLARADALTSL